MSSKAYDRAHQRITQAVIDECHPDTLTREEYIDLLKSLIEDLEARVSAAEEDAAPWA